MKFLKNLKFSFFRYHGNFRNQLHNPAFGQTYGNYGKFRGCKYWTISKLRAGNPDRNTDTITGPINRSNIPVNPSQAIFETMPSWINKYIDTVENPVYCKVYRGSQIRVYQIRDMSFKMIHNDRPVQYGPKDQYQSVLGPGFPGQKFWKLN